MSSERRSRMYMPSFSFIREEDGRRRSAECRISNHFNHGLHRYDPDKKSDEMGGARFVVTDWGAEF